MSQKPLDERFYDQEMIRLFAPLEEEFKGRLSLYVSGSWGERRLTTSSDQDHLIITEFPLSDKEIQVITQQMHKIAVKIEELGLQQCDAQMMASNPHYLFTVSDLVKLNPVDVIGVFKGRLLSGTELRSKDFYDYYHGTHFRKGLFKLLLSKFLSLLITFKSKKKERLLKHMAMDEQFLFQSAKLQWSPRPLSTNSRLSRGLSILINCFTHYESFFS